METHLDCCLGRRNILTSMVAIAGSAALPGVASAAGDSASHLAHRPSAGRIDTHAHLWPEEYLDFLTSNGDKGTPVARNIRATASDADLAARFAMMDKAGVDKQVLSATPQVLQSDDAAACLQGARMINDYYAALRDRHPTRFLAYGAVPLPHVDEAIAEARRAIEVLGFSGIALNTLIAGKTIASPAYLPFYQEMNRLGAIVYIHPTGCGSLSPMVNDFHLEWVVGAPFEDSLAVLHLLKADIPHKFPNIRFHVAHLGGALAFMMQRIEDNFTDWKAFPRSPTAELRKFWFDTANFHPPALRCMVETLGHERLILGSDFPYFQDDNYTRAVTYIAQAGLPAATVRAIRDFNAQRLLAGGVSRSK